MCFHTKQTTEAKTLQTRFNAKFEDSNLYVPKIEQNGFTFPKTPIITNTAPQIIQLFNWGFLPTWAKDMDFRKNTLNAKIETISEKPSFNSYIQNRCIILINGFYEWQWQDSKGKNKIKYLITIPDEEPFALAGLWNIWTNTITNEMMPTYTILTTVANPQMSEIHNSKKRMPMILNKEEESLWLSGKHIDYYRALQLVTTKMESPSSGLRNPALFD